MQEKKNQSVAAESSKIQSSGESTFQFVDNRSEAIAQRKLQEMAKNSQRVMQLKSFQRMISDSHKRVTTEHLAPLSIQRKSSESIRSQKVAQLAAADLTTAVSQMTPAPTNYNFVDNGSFITVNGILDAAEGYLRNMMANDEANFRKLLNATYDVNAGVALDHQANKDLKAFQKSDNKRLRFRPQIGKAGGGIASEVDTFMTKFLEPIWGKPLPDWIINMDLHNRARLYDLPNAGGRSKQEHHDSLVWAHTQGANDVSKLVNYAEYYMASLDRLEADVERNALARYDAAKGGIAVDQTKVPAKAQEIANKGALDAEKARLDSIYNPIIGRVFQKNSLSPQDSANLTTINVNSANYDLSKKADKSKLRENIIKAVGDALTAYGKTAAATAETVTEGHIANATAELRKELEDQLMKTSRAAARMEETTAVPTKFAAETKEARDTNYAGAMGPKAADDFWAKDFRTQVATIKAAASQKIPFFSDHAAAYHALKHYGDIAKTEDRAENTGLSMNEAYYASATKTVKNPTEAVVSSSSQLRDHPSFFFYRTVPKDTKITDAQDVRMWAIVVVNDAGNVGLATYFQKK